MSGHSVVKRLMTGRRIVIVISVLTWSLIFFAGSLPVLKKSIDNRNRITSVSDRMESMNRICVAGVWLEAAVRRLEPPLIDEYDRLFPHEKDCEKLFLELAKIAGKNHIDPFNLHEVTVLSDGGGLEEPEDPLDVDSGDQEVSMMIDQFAADISSLPGSQLETYRLSISFDTDYESMTRFLADLESIERAVTLHSLGVEPGPHGIIAELELDYYAQRTD